MRQNYSVPVLLRHAARAGFDLAAARIALRRIKPQDVVAENRRIAEEIGIAPPHRDPAAACDEAAFFIGRMAARVPWRSDCLVQALAGQRWLTRKGIATEIVVGAAKRPDGSLEAHAWLRHRERVVLGGDITPFRTLIDPDS